MKFIDPYELDDSKNDDPYQISASFLEDTNAVKSQTKQDLYFAAFARADKRVRFGFNATDGNQGNGYSGGAFFPEHHQPKFTLHPGWFRLDERMRCMEW